MREDLVEVGGHRLHYRLLPADPQVTPLLFLHEGLGSIELWRDFPQRVTERSGHPSLVFSRYGYGWSEPLREPREPHYMHVEGREVLPRLVELLLDRPPILIGHSDGASIAIIYAGSGHPVKGLILLAPHVFTEAEGLASIAALRDSFPESDLGERMAKYHTDSKATFYGWADIWLDPRFRAWNLEEYLASIACPVLLIQCEEDEYGSRRQLEAIASQVAGPVEKLLVPGSGHSPHLVEPEMVTEAVTSFVDAVSV